MHNNKYSTLQNMKKSFISDKMTEAEIASGAGEEKNITYLRKLPKK